MTGRDTKAGSDRPGIDDQCIGLLVQQHTVQQSCGRIGVMPGISEGSPRPYKRLEGEPAGIDLATFLHETLKVLVEV